LVRTKDLCKLYLNASRKERERKRKTKLLEALLMDFPAKGYKELREDCPDIPADTCPLVDKTLKHVTEIEINLEQLRDQNEALRDVGKFWRATAINLLEECCDLYRHIEKLENE
tara:strand:- start:146 stop:487 length:342 start_codon:yes stop_codon:yes gene_type:complete